MTNPIYSTIKAQELNFPIPQPAASIKVGAMDANGQFVYAVPTYQTTILHPDPPRHPVPFDAEGGAVQAINIFALKLRFEFDNSTGDGYVIWNGTTVHANRGENFVEFDPGGSKSINFTLFAKGRKFTSDAPLTVDRHIVAAGAFTVAALPITIVYAPPADEQQKNSASWMESQSASVSTTFAINEANSSTVPAPDQVDVVFRNWNELASDMKLLSTAMKNAGDAELKAIATALDVIAGLTGSSSVNFTQSISTTRQDVLTTTWSTSDNYSTSAKAGGPGQADAIIYLRNARLCWYVDASRKLQLALIDWQEEAYKTANFLKQPGAAGLDDQTRASLLALDPFATGGATPLLPPKRFAYVATVAPAGGGTGSKPYTFTRSSAQMQQTVALKTRLEDDSASLLAFAGFGVTQTGKFQASFSLTNSTTASSAFTLTRNYQFNTAPGESYQFEIYCDVVLGTFAFCPIPAGLVGTTQDKAIAVSIAAQAAERLEVSRVAVDGTLWKSGHSNGDSWQPFGMLGQLANRAVELSAAGRPDGGMDVVMVGLDGNMWRNRQQPDGSWTGFVELIGNRSNKALKIALAPFADGRLDLYMVGLDGNLWHNAETKPGVWTGFQMVGNSANKAIDIAVTRRADGLVDVAMVGIDGNMWLNHQSSASNWTGFTERIGTAANRAHAIAAAIPAQGQLDVYMIGLDANLYKSSRQAGGGWSAFQKIFADQQAKDIAACALNGVTTLAIVNASGNVIALK